MSALTLLGQVVRIPVAISTQSVPIGPICGHKPATPSPRPNHPSAQVGATPPHGGRSAPSAPAPPDLHDAFHPIFRLCDPHYHWGSAASPPHLQHRTGIYS